MPTFLRLDTFLEDFRRLTPEQQARFRRVVLDEFVPDLVTGRFRPGLRVKRVQSMPGVWEMTWAPDGRATWQYGADTRPARPVIKINLRYVALRQLPCRPRIPL
ncbi:MULTISPECIES: hypothetical protein [unclassified Frankia]|uniref:hypothetical protein n=1 Tax=unclassified Frankia TaxID=2632575 RepID=UPI001EF4EF82|nr:MULTISPECIES: hypothetical protein [unclassified Frankia]